MSSQCEEKARCKKCKGEHPHCLHKTAQDWEETKEKSTSPTETSVVNKETKEKDVSSKSQKDSNSKDDLQKQKVTNTTKRNAPAELLNMVVPVYVSADNTAKRILTYAVLDNGSDTTYMSTEIANTLRPPGKPEQITVSTITGTKTSETTKYTISIRSYVDESDQKSHVLQAYEQDHIPCNASQIPTDKMASHLPHLESIASLLSPRLDISVGLLIGRDYAYMMAPHETILGKDNEPFAIKTPLGWTLCGGHSNHQKSQKKFTHLTQTREFEDLDELKRISQNELKFLELLENGMEQADDGSITLPLPFKEVAVMPNNKVQAERRLNQLTQRFRKDPQLKEEYFHFMEEMIKNGHAELVPDSEPSKGKVWYLPHFSVHHPKKKKIRVVFDASVQFQGKCLNDQLLPGPDHINNLVGILLRFRTKPIGLSCDIEKMFHNFKVTESHRDFLRFLWVEPDLSTVKEYRMRVHLFGATSSPGVATFALRKLAVLASSEKPEASEFITKDFYVDDGITSVDSTAEAIKLANDARELCADANLRLHKFVSNSREVLQALPTSEIAKEVQDLDLCKDKLPVERTLGMEWLTDEDCFTYNSNFSGKPNTKRGILSELAQVYDPLGLLAPFVLQGRILMQQACQESVGWNDKVSDDLSAKWANWKEQLSDLQNIKIPRCLKPPNFMEAHRAELHYFSDASLDGYGTCCYLRLVNENNNVHVSLVMAKTRVAPLKSITIPRLELQACVEAVRLQRLLHEELKMTVDAEYFWSDSTVALGFISNSSAKYQMFVANRVSEIHRSTNTAQWHHVPGSANPADMASRGCNLAALHSSDWWTGPSFLHQPDINSWLKVDVDYGHLVVDSVEIKKPNQTISALTVTDHNLQETVNKFSSWKKLVKAIATAKMMLRLKSFKKPEILAEHLEQAENCLLKAEQQRVFPNEIRTLKEKQMLPKGSKIRSLTPFLDENGLLRMRSRATSGVSFKERNPVILPKCHLSELLLSYFHSKTYHQGHHIAISALRQAGFWVTGASTLAKSLTHRCIKCKRMRAKPTEQQMGNLPKERTEQSPPFTCVGIDTFGPFTVRDRRTDLKRYGVLFTCLYSRALHIEAVDDLSTDSFLQALRRLQAVRGPVTTIYSDGGTNFIGGRNQMEHDLLSMKDIKLQEYLSSRQIKFQTNTPTASHQGGVWERQIRTIRSILNGMSSRYHQRMTTESLRTALYEVMATVNSTPLASSCASSAENVITPSHLLTMKSPHLPPPPGEFTDTEIYGRSMYRKSQQLATEFWHMWTSQYLTRIESRAKWEKPREDVKVGDIVIIVDSNEPRNLWKSGIIDSVHRGSDGKVRKTSVMVGTTDLNKYGRPLKPRLVLERPVQKLIKIMST